MLFLMAVRLGLQFSKRAYNQKDLKFGDTYNLPGQAY